MKRHFPFFFVIILIFSFSTPVYAASDSETSNWYDGIVDFFVPDENYFNNKSAELNDHVNKKLGGVSYLFQMLHSFFSTLQTAPDNEFEFAIPDNHLFKGFKGSSGNLFAGAVPFIRILRSSISAFFCIVTAIACYRKVITIFEK